MAVSSPTIGSLVQGTSEPTPAPPTDTPRPPDTPTPAPTPTLISPPGAAPSGPVGAASPPPMLPSLASTAPTTPSVPNGSPSPSSPGPASAATTSPAATPAPERVRVAVAAQGANVRREPGTTGAVLRSLPNGAELVVVGPDRTAEGQAWRNVRSPDGSEGWIVGAAVETVATPVPSPAAPPPTPIGTPSAEMQATAAVVGPVATEPVAVVTAGVTAGATPEGTGTPVAPSTATPLPTATAMPTAVPERARIATGSQGANLRAEPGTDGRLVKPLREGAELTVIGPNREVAGQVWRNVRDAAGDEGWVVGEAVTSLSPPATPPPTAAPPSDAPAQSPSGAAPSSAVEAPEDGVAETPPAPEDPATPCRTGQIKGDAASGLYYLPDHPEYAATRDRVRCFDAEARAGASGFLPAP